MVRRVGPKWYRLRFEVLERDDFQCQYCGQRAPNVKLEVDHKIPVIEGGTDDLENLVASCWACNRGKVGLWAYRTQRKVRLKQRVTPTLSVLIMARLADGEATVLNIAKQLNGNPGTIRTTMARLRKQEKVKRRQENGQVVWFL